MVEEEIVIRKVIWGKAARYDLRDHYNRIKKSSPQAAEVVKAKIFSSTNPLKEHPFMYEADRCMLNNDGSFRAYHVYDYRISYRVKGSMIRILRVTHSSQEPREY